MECEQADRSRSLLRQGDVLASHPGTQNWNNPWRRFFIVVSADCDIVNSKLETGLVVVPVVGLETFARHVWLPEAIQRLAAAFHKKAETNLAKIGYERSASSVLQASIGDLNTDFERLVRSGEDLSGPKKALISLAEGYQTVLKLAEEVRRSDEVPLRDKIERFCAAKSVVHGGSPAPEKELKAGLAASSDPKRVDLWPICDLIGLDGQMRSEEKGGFVAVMRRFTVIPIESSRVDKQSWLSNPDLYLRVCRLRGIYKSDFLNKFANMFTRVGLDAGRDAEHERNCEQAVERLMRAEGMR